MTTGIKNTSTVKKTIGSRLQKARQEKSFSRQAVVDLLNAHTKAPSFEARKLLQIETYKKWETAENSIQIEWIPAICDVLGCDIGYLFGEYAEKKREFSDVCETTGLSEKAVKQLYLLYHHPHCESGLGVMAKGYTIGHVDILSKILESKGMLEFFNSLGFYLIYGGVLPKDAYTSNEEDLTCEEHERFYKWANDHGLEIQPRKDICEMYLQKACDVLKNIFRDILERVKKDNG